MICSNSLQGALYGLQDMDYKMKRMLLMTLSAFILFVASLSIISAQNVTVCCEKTISGLYCQDVPASQCASDAMQVPTSCKSTSYCRPGLCFDSSEGTCLSNTPQKVCNQNHGIWTDKAVSQCDLGCCILGDQAAFVTLTRCKKLSSFLGLETNYNKNLKTETACIASVLGQEKGACVFESDLQKTCRMTTRADCLKGGNVTTGFWGGLFGSTTVKKGGEFFKGKLCSAEELGTNCGPTEKTVCVPGKEEVYFVDSCGNPANIYDAAKLKDKEYWANMKDQTEACNPATGNANSGTCGNCNYLLGTFCRKTTRTTSQAAYGENICADLNCKKTSNGNDYKHGESWCVYDDEGELNNANNAVGSRYYKHVCVNGEEILEACADYRQHECIEDKITYPGGTFSQAACRVNRWEDCVLQTAQSDCENGDKRDCKWMAGEALTSTPAALGSCVPKNSPGLKFWEGEEAKKVCGLANYKCTIIYEKGLTGLGSQKKHATENEKCDEQWWIDSRKNICMAMGDCGPKINWVGETGSSDTFSVS